MTHRILLLEDEQAIADTLLFALRREGFEVQHWQLAREALAAFAARHTSKPANCPSSSSRRGAKRSDRKSVV